MFERRDPERRFDQWPSRQIGSAGLSTEVRWTRLQLPAEAGLAFERGRRLIVGPRATMTATGAMTDTDTVGRRHP